MTAVAIERPAELVIGKARSLVLLTLTEGLERFSYYGVSTLLVLYMSQVLLLPGHADTVLGLGALRNLLQGASGPLTPVALAAQIFGLYAGLVYFMPILGGLIADRWLGRRLCVALGAAALCLGQLALTSERTFVLALAVLVFGEGLIKGNVTAQVGDLYADQEDEARTRGFAIFSTGINIGAIAGPILCGLVAQVFGWRWAFALASSLMLAGLIIYLVGARHLPAPSRALALAADRAAPSGRDTRVVVALVVVMLIAVFQSIAAFQSLAIGLVWIHTRVDPHIWGLAVPVAWFAALIPLAGALGLPLVLRFWRWQAARGREPDPMGKIATGAGLAAVANLVLAAGCLIPGRAPIVVPLVCNVILGVAYLYYWPTLLALVSGSAPGRLKGVMVSSVFLVLFVASLVAGRLGGLFEVMGEVRFWMLHAGIALAGVMLALALARPLRRALAAA